MSFGLLLRRLVPVVVSFLVCAAPARTLQRNLIGVDFQVVAGNQKNSDDHFAG